MEELVMQKVFFVKNGELDEVNKLLENGYCSISMIKPVAENISGDRAKSPGDIYAYVVVNDLTPIKPPVRPY